MAEKRNIKVRGGSIRKAAFIDIAQEQATTKVDLRDLERIQRELVIEWREELLYYKQEGERLSDLILEPCTLSIMKLMRGAATGNQDLSEESLSELIYALRGATIELAAALMKGEQQTSGLYQAMEESTGYDEWAETALQLVSIVQQLQEIESQIEKILTELNHHSKDWQRRLARDSRAIDDAIIFLAESEQCFNLVANDYIGGASVDATDFARLLDEAQLHIEICEEEERHVGREWTELLELRRTELPATEDIEQCTLRLEATRRSMLTYRRSYGSKELRPYQLNLIAKDIFLRAEQYLDDSANWGTRECRARIAQLYKVCMDQLVRKPQFAQEIVRKLDRAKKYLGQIEQMNALRDKVKHVVSQPIIIAEAVPVVASALTVVLVPGKGRVEYLSDLVFAIASVEATGDKFWAGSTVNSMLWTLHYMGLCAYDEVHISLVGKIESMIRSDIEELCLGDDTITKARTSVCTWLGKTIERGKRSTNYVRLTECGLSRARHMFATYQISRDEVELAIAKKKAEWERINEKRKQNWKKK